MKITDQTFYDYIDEILTNDEKRQFEDYIQNNSDAELKLKEFISIDKKIKKSFSDPNINEFRIPEDLSKDYNDLLQNIDNYKKNSSENLVQKKANYFNETKESFFKRNLSWLFPVQSFALAGLLAYVLLPFNVSNQVANNQSSDDFFMQLANYELQEFLPNSQYGDSKAVKINSQSFDIRDITTTFKTRSAAQASSYECNKNLDTKILEIFPPDNPLDKKILTYCSDLDKNNWILLNIKISKDKKTLNLSGNYKILLEKDSLYLFPQD